MKHTFTNSDGWNESPPSWIQLRAPYFSTPKIRLNTSSPMPATAARYRTAFARSRSRSDQQTARNTHTPAQTASSSLARLSGAELDTTASPIVHRKNASVSASNPVLRKIRSPRYSAHSSPISPPNAVSSSAASHPPRISCSAASS